ncbi:MAG: hypothetical protein HQL56_05735 [Magnetococcales bacterium]|nr:hypothetical protein [Magnetococcales bacterium]
MKERPIIFNTESVLAILDGRKTVTRRVINPQPIKDKRNPDYRLPSWSLRQGRTYCEWFFGPQNTTSNGDLLYWRSPYGEPGYRLWVKEMWYPSREGAVYYADNEHGFVSPKAGWKSPLFMPRSVSRIILEVVDLRAERLHEITNEETIKEGVEYIGQSLYRYNHLVSSEAVNLYEKQWNNINAKRGYHWEDNPWVWRVEFRRFQDDMPVR